MGTTIKIADLKSFIPKTNNSDSSSYYVITEDLRLPISFKEIRVEEIKIYPLYDTNGLFLNSTEGRNYLELDSRFVGFFLENPGLIPESWKTKKTTRIHFGATRFCKVFPESSYKHARVPNFTDMYPTALVWTGSVWEGCCLGNAGSWENDYVAVIRKRN